MRIALASVVVVVVVDDWNEEPPTDPSACDPAEKCYCCYSLEHEHCWKQKIPSKIMELKQTKTHDSVVVVR